MRSRRAITAPSCCSATPASPWPRPTQIASPRRSIPDRCRFPWTLFTTGVFLLIFVRRFEPEAGAVSVVLDGRTVAAAEGELLAVLLLRMPPFPSRPHPVPGSLPPPLCLLGVCFLSFAEHGLGTCMER